MGKRKEAYARGDEKFSFLTYRKLTEVEIKAKAINLVQSYPSDLEVDFIDEFLIFFQLYNETTGICEMLQSLIRDKLISSFPNVNIAMIYLAILGTSCGERSFSKLKVVKNCLRSTIGQSKLSSLSLLSIECELLRSIYFRDVIIQFAKKKSRKVTL